MFFALGSLHFRVLQICRDFFNFPTDKQTPANIATLANIKVTVVQSMGHVFVRAPGEMFEFKVPSNQFQLEMREFPNVISSAGCNPPKFEV
jgi:hypothetical protein